MKFNDKITKILCTGQKIFYKNFFSLHLYMKENQVIAFFVTCIYERSAISKIV